MSDVFRVFVVDDDLVILELLTEILGEFCLVETFSSAEACGERLVAERPDLVLLDVSLPAMDGYTFCRRLKDDWDTQDIPVLFMSSRDDIDSRLSCYEAGGEDFIAKPFQPSEIRRKFDVAQRIISEKRSLKAQAGYATQTAMSAMTSMGELGVVLQFLSKSFACNTLEEVAHAMLEAMQQFGLDSAVRLQIGEQEMAISHNGHDVPLEVAILNHVRSAGRIFQFKTRCVFNYGRVTLMVNNMPLEDAERCGRIRDNGAILAEGADARLRAIETEQAAQHRQVAIEEALPRVQSALDALQANYRRNCFDLTQTMIEFQEALAKSFITLGLTESQEEQMTETANEYMQRMIGTQDESLHIVSDLEELANDLRMLAAR